MARIPVLGHVALLLSLLLSPTVEAKGKSAATDTVDAPRAAASLTDPEPQRRRAALHALATQSDPQAAEAIAAHSRGETHPVVRRAARDALRRVPLDIAQWLELLAHSPNPQTRAVAADVLGHMPDAQVLDALREAVSDDEPAVRREIYEALARSGDRTLMPVLIRAAAKESDARARESAERGAEYLASGPPSRAEADAALANLESDSESARNSAARALALRKDWRATRTLIRWIQGTDPQRRALAIRAAGDLGDPTMVPVLIAQLPEVGRTQSAIFASLANIGDESAGDTFETYFAAEHAETRRLAVRGLGRLKLPDLAEKFEDIATDPTISVRNEILLALESLPTAQKQKLLLQALEDPIGPHRAAAIRQLATGEASTVGPDITKRLDDRDALVRISAAEALRQLGYTASLDSLRKRARKTKDEDERAYYLTAITRLEKL